MPVTRVPTVFHPEGGGCDDVDDDRLNPAIRKKPLDRCYDDSGLDCGAIITRSAIDGAGGTGANSAKRSANAFVGFLGIKMRAILIGVLGVLLVQFAGASGPSSKEGEIKVEIKMPREAVEGSSIELRCEWQLLGGIGLYSIKWYKDGHEFFRYMPDSDPKILTFPREGVSLERKPNSEKSIRLVNVRLETSGQYKCEASAEGPSFASFQQIAHLTVIALPERGPEITGLSSHYAVGENVTANCTAWPSVPKANLRWTINGEAVPPENTVQHPPLTPVKTKGIPNSLGLRLEAEPRHFEGGGGLVRIKCIAEVGSRVFEAEKKVLMAYVNNQRLSAGDLRSNRGCRLDDRFLYGPLIFSVILIVVAT